MQDALRFYNSHTSQIEVVRHDRTLEQIVFPIPEICEYLTEDTKLKLFTNAERDDQVKCLIRAAKFFKSLTLSRGLNF